MLPIGRSPSGLLELLGLKGSGANPRSLSEVLQGTLALDQLYLAPLRTRTIAVTSVINANGNWVAMTVPAAELWLLENVTYYTGTALGAGESYRLVPGIFWAGSAAAQQNLGVEKLWQATDRPAQGYDLPTPIILQPGVQIGLSCIAVSSGAAQYTVAAHYYRLAF